MNQVNKMALPELEIPSQGETWKSILAQVEKLSQEIEQEANLKNITPAQELKNRLGG